MATALVIDDSRAMRSLLSRMVKQLGFETETAGNGQEALDLLQARGERVDICLVDWNMPVMDGITFVRTIRTMRAYDKTKVIMVTSEGSPRNVYEAMKAGADEYAMKPVTIEILADKLMLLGIELEGYEGF